MRLSSTPSSSEPTTAPSGLSSPPSTAPAKAYSSTGCIRFWSKLASAGAVSIPETAPIAAASPQPSASIQLTRTPTSRVASGLTAVAREASPSLVKRKKSQSSATAPSETAIVPRSWIEKATPAISIGRVEKAFGRLRTSGDQIQRAAPLTRKKSPRVTITTVSTGARSTGLITTRSTAIPPTNENATVRKKAAQYERPWWTSDQATKVENIAISPCAKLITPVER